MIQGGSFGDTKNLMESYYFSNRPKIWGWATWRRAHELFEPDLDSWSNLTSGQRVALLLSLGFSPREARHKLRVLEGVDSLDTWDYQWVVSLWMNGLTSAAPKVNLVENKGFGPNATHTRFESLSVNLPRAELDFELYHPREICANLVIDASESRQAMKRRLLHVALHPVETVMRFVRYYLTVWKRL
jgi:hypothetical protein